MKKDSFLIELITSFPFKVLIFLTFLILAGVTISKCNTKKVQMKEDVLYIKPKPKA